MVDPPQSFDHDEDTRDPGAEPHDAITRPQPRGRDIDRDTVQRIVGARYAVERAAGTGGMGHVVAATDTVLRRRVAIKLLHRGGLIGEPAAAPDTRQRTRILDEARAMAGLRHPNLCPVHEVSIDGEVPFIVMDWIDGVDLRAAWRDWDLNRRLSLYMKIVDAVAAAHAADVVHGDLKPANILVDRGGEPIIVDFGLARSSADLDSRSGIAGGTPGYAAPEQFEEQASVTPAADVYALGVLLYELVTDRRPFHANSPAGLLLEIETTDPPLPEVHAPDAPWPLQRICLVALERAPERRYPDAHALRQDLRRYLRDETVAARPSMLTDRFETTVETQLGQVDSWHRQGLVTGTEADKLRRLLTSILRPESHWILDSRRLTLSQVTLYLGGWLALIALTIGMLFTAVPDDALESFPSARYLTAWAVAVLLLGAGLWLQQRGQRRVSLAYLVTACLGVPVACWLLMRERQWLAGPMERTVEFPPASPGEPAMVETQSQEWLRVLLDLEPVPELGLSNWQVLVMMLAWLAVAVGLRRRTASSAFTLFAVIAAALGSIAAWASAGLLVDDHDAFARLGLWMTIVGLAVLWPGLRMNAHEEAITRRHGPARVRTRDSWAVLTGVLVLVGLGLTIMAAYAADAYTLGLIGDDEDTSTIAVAFIMNGVALQVLAYVLGRERTVVRTRLAEAIRWVSPSHFVLGLYFLFWDARWDERDVQKWVWLLSMIGVSVALCYVSVWKQWRPFLLTGLFYVAVGYGTVFSEVIEALEDDPAVLDSVRLVLAAGVLVLGIATMLLAWKLPDWLAGARLGRWSRKE